MKKLPVILFLLLSLNGIAQKTHTRGPVIQKGFYLSFNPLSIVELEQGAVGIGVGYRFSKRIEIWNEINYLYKGILPDNDYVHHLSGFRNITSLKYYYNTKHSFFVGVEFRIKQYSFDDRNNFVNAAIGDTIYNYAYRPKHTLIGGAVFWGKRFKITANGKFELEGNIGIGVKQRMIDRTQVPPGYVKYVNTDFIPKDKSLRGDHDIEQTLPYFPAIFRFIYHL